MEWGTFITVIFALYLAWYGINFLIDIIAAGKPKMQHEQAVQYNVSDFLGEEEQAREVNGRDYDEPVATVDPAAAVTLPDTTNSGGQAQRAAVPPPVPLSGQNATPVATVRPISNPLDDWASGIDQEEEIIEINVQAQPIPAMDFLQSFKNNAKSKAASIFS